MTLVALLFACGTDPSPVDSDEALSPLDTAATGDTGGTATDLTGLVVNELMAYDVATGFAGGADWIELYNGATERLDLSGVALWSDDGGEGRQYPWMFPAGSSIPAGAFLVVVCDGTNAGGATPHASFFIERHGGTIELIGPAGTLDEVTYDEQLTGLSTARTTDGGAEWATGVTPTPAESNE